MARISLVTSFVGISETSLSSVVLLAEAGAIIAIASILLIWGVKGYLAGKSASPEIEKQIRDAVMEIEEVNNIVELATMYLGTHKLLLHLDIEVGSSTTAEEL
jgi:divalent metal cation (Fe/Co/Zn/Cd) transporter